MKKVISGLLLLWMVLLPSFSSAEPSYIIPSQRWFYAQTTFGWRNLSLVNNSYISSNHIDWTFLCISPYLWYSITSWLPRAYLVKCDWVSFSSTTVYVNWDWTLSWDYVDLCEILFLFTNVSYNDSNILASDMSCFGIDSDDTFFIAKTSTQSYQVHYSQTFINYNSLKNYFNSWYILPSECPSSSMSSYECQSEYNLIPIDEVDSAYCESNNLCTSSSDPIDCPNVWVSNLFINDVFHPWAFNVIMNIPEEIDRDYAYTNSWSNINIDVVWYNQDTEYINSLIDINDYKPNSDDFSKVFGLFDRYWWLLIACLFIILVFYFVKKIFK